MTQKLTTAAATTTTAAVTIRSTNDSSSGCMGQLKNVLFPSIATASRVSLFVGSIVVIMSTLLSCNNNHNNHNNHHNNMYAMAYQPLDMTYIRRRVQQSTVRTTTSTNDRHTLLHQHSQQRRNTFELYQSTSSSTVTSDSSPQSSSSSMSSSSMSSSSLLILENDPNIEYTIMNPNVISSDEWELDCYSRPVMMNDDNNKKLWQILITDSIGSFRYIHRLPSNQVNSKTVRSIIDNFIDMNPNKPNVIRFFRGAMFNMIQIALSELPNVTSKPSRCTFALASWLEELYNDVYPNMEGYNPSMVATSSSSSSFLDVRTPIKLPDALRGEKYAFVSLPLQEFLPDTTTNNNNDSSSSTSSSSGINADNIGVGRLCPIPKSLFLSSSSSTTIITADTFVQGVVILSSRAAALAAWLAGTEVVALQANLRKRILTMETDIDNQYLMAKLNDQQRIEAVAFEEGKDLLQGLHFISVQKTEDDDPEGFWLLRELPNGI